MKKNGCFYALEQQEYISTQVSLRVSQRLKMVVAAWIYADDRCTTTIPVKATKCSPKARPEPSPALHKIWWVRHQTRPVSIRITRRRALILSHISHLSYSLYPYISLISISHSFATASSEPGRSPADSIRAQPNARPERNWPESEHVRQNFASLVLLEMQGTRFQWTDSKQNTTSFRVGLV